MAQQQITRIVQQGDVASLIDEPDCTIASPPAQKIKAGSLAAAFWLQGFGNHQALTLHGAEYETAMGVGD
ncbi:hypothetical protein RvVAT039_28530 [Agrobacterium vitis]|nr:hypothetical protein RvVAT039_28530 [Agrobacterium vitis]